MLILTRRIGETVIIGGNINVTVLGTKGNQVRLGVDAPKDVSVHREEIQQRVDQGLPAPGTNNVLDYKGRSEKFGGKCPKHSAGNGPCYCPGSAYNPEKGGAR